jgi:hypothetical protein
MKRIRKQDRIFKKDRRETRRVLRNLKYYPTFHAEEKGYEY